MVQYSIVDVGEYGPIVERHDDWDDPPAKKTGWHAFEWFARYEYYLTPTQGHDDDAYDPKTDKSVEIKSCLPRNDRDAHGRMIHRNSQHMDILANGSDYIFGLYRPLGQQHFEMVDAVRISGRDYHDAVNIDDRTWTRGFEMGVRWTAIPSLAVEEWDEDEYIRGEFGKNI